MTPIIKSLYFYPLKSAQGIQTDSLEITETGPRFDREWMLINESNKFITQRTHPKLSQIQTNITNNNLVCKIDNQTAIEIPLEKRGEAEIKVSLFGKPAAAALLPQEYGQWFSDFLGQKVSLVRSPKSKTRTTSGRKGPVTPIQFADGYPLLLTSLSTLDELSRRAGQDIPMLRFRPNIIIENAPVDAEDTWSQFSIRNVEFLCAKACSRCVIIDVDPKTAIKGKIVSSELKKYRQQNNEILFGINLIHNNLGTLKIGDNITNITQKENYTDPA